MELFRNCGNYAGLNSLDFNILKDDKVLDVGGGNKPFKHCTHLIDKEDGDNQRHGKAIKKKGLEFFNGDVCEVLEEFPDDYFDFCYSSHTFEHIDNLPLALDMINKKCKRGFYALPASDFEFLTAKKHFHHVNLCRLLGGVLHIAKRPQNSTIDKFSHIFEKKLFGHKGFNKLWEGHGCRGFRFIWEARHYWENKIEYSFYDNPIDLFPQLAYFDKEKQK